MIVVLYTTYKITNFTTLYHA